MPNDLDCMIEERLTNMRCTWNNTDGCSTWKLFYSFNHVAEKEHNITGGDTPDGCANGGIETNQKERLLCDINKTEQFVFRIRLISGYYKFRFRLQRHNAFGHKSETVIWKTPNHEIVKLPPVQKFHVDKTTTTLALSWKLPYPPGYFNEGMSCSVTCGEQFRKLDFDAKSKDTYVKRVVFESLKPFTEYNVSVTCQVSGSRFWSDTIKRVYRTEEDVPLVGPTTTTQSYTFGACKEDSHSTCLNIYVKPVEASKARGNITGYEVIIRGGKPSELIQIPEVKTTLELGPIDKGIFPPVNVSIWSKTSKGSSTNSTDIYVYRATENGILEEVIVEEEAEYYLVTAAPNTMPSQYTFHWCYGQYRNPPTVMCKEGYEYSSVPGPEIRIAKKALKRPEKALEDADKNNRWYFGTSVNTSSKGVHWEDCFFKAGSVNDIQPRRPILSEGMYNQILVAVQPFCPTDDKAGSLRPINYTVVYDNMDDPNDNHTKVFDARFKTSQLTLDNLKPGVKYKVVYNIGYREQTSPFSEPAFKYINNQHKIAIIVGSAVGSTLSIIITIVIIWEFTMYYRKIEQPIDCVEIDQRIKEKHEIYSDDTENTCHGSDQMKKMRYQTSLDFKPKHQDSEPPINNRSSSESDSDKRSSSYRILKSIPNERDMTVDSDSYILPDISEDIAVKCSNNGNTSPNSSGVVSCQSIPHSDVNPSRSEQRPLNCNSGRFTSAHDISVEIGDYNNSMIRTSSARTSSDSALDEFHINLRNKRVGQCDDVIHETCLHHKGGIVLIQSTDRSFNDQSSKCTISKDITISATNPSTTKTKAPESTTNTEASKSITITDVPESIIISEAPECDTKPEVPEFATKTEVPMNRKAVLRYKELVKDTTTRNSPLTKVESHCGVPFFEDLEKVESPVDRGITHGLPIDQERVLDTKDWDLVNTEIILEHIGQIPTDDGSTRNNAGQLPDTETILDIISLLPIGTEATQNITCQSLMELESMYSSNEVPVNTMNLESAGNVSAESESALDITGQLSLDLDRMLDIQLLNKDLPFNHISESEGMQKPVLKTSDCTKKIAYKALPLSKS
ncbi:uncharacterized protein [Argopecten irradians]